MSKLIEARKLTRHKTTIANPKAAEKLPSESKRGKSVGASSGQYGEYNKTFHLTSVRAALMMFACVALHGRRAE